MIMVVSLVSGCGGGGGSTSVTPSLPLESNVLAVTVDAGPANTGYNVNRLYATVKVCLPGSTDCRTIDHVLVDTGSTGLRLLSSAISPALNLNQVSAGAAGLPLLNCAQFVDNSFAWGPVARADIVLAGKTAANVPIQIMGAPAFSSLAAACSSAGTAISTAATLGANGILGLGLFKEDCGSGCAVIPANGFYYTCVDFTCATTVGTTVAVKNQVQNPVPLFTTDNNGVLVDLPPVYTTTAPRLDGRLIFGIGTRSNNQFAPGSVLTTSTSGDISTLFAGQSRSKNFIDTGSNGLFVDLVSIPHCGSPAIGFYCPSSLTSFPATLAGTNAAIFQFSFFIDSALKLIASYPDAVLPGLAGPINSADMFVWGLPFFYGRPVFFGIEGQSSSLGTGPFYAF